MSDESEYKGVLSRWSKRKLNPAKVEQATDSSSDEQKQFLDAREAELAANQEAAEAIDLDTIDEDSDLSLFLKEGVPESLKKAALTKLWRSSPVFANVDGLVDYDDNFADPDLIMKTFTSAYQVGRGYLQEVLEDPADQVDEIVNTDSEILSNVADSKTEGSINRQEESEPEFVEAEESTVIETEEVNVASVNIAENTEVEVPGVSLRNRLGLSDTKIKR